jgi:hypothetical protein
MNAGQMGKTVVPTVFVSREARRLGERVLPEPGHGFPWPGANSALKVDIGAQQIMKYIDDITYNK